MHSPPPCPIFRMGPTLFREVLIKKTIQIVLKKGGWGIPQNTKIRINNNQLYFKFMKYELLKYSDNVFWTKQFF